MGLLETLLARATPGDFPAYEPPPEDLTPIDWRTRSRKSLPPPIPFLNPAPGATPLPEGSLLPFGTLAAGMPPPVAQPPVEVPAAAAAAPPPAAETMDDTPPSFAGGVPLPRSRPKEPDGSDVMPTDLSSSSRPPPGQMTNIRPPAAMAPAAAPSAAADEPMTFGSLARGLMKGLSNNSNTLLALGAGFAGAPSIGQGISRAASSAIPASQMDLKNRITLDSQRQNYQALREAGVPPNLALAAMSNPDVMKAITAKYFETKPLQHVMQKDALGGEVPMAFDPNTGKYRDAAGVELKPDATAGSSGPGGALLAPGVQYDATATGEDYLKQFSPEVQAAVKKYIAGDVMPSGNARAKTIATYAKTVAQKYGLDLGIPVSDALYSEKRKYRTELGTNSANSVGGQVKAFAQGIEHADALAKTLEKLGNVDPLGIPVVASFANTMREGFSTKQKDIANQAKSIGQTLAGEVGKLFSGSQGGGVHERELTRKRFDTVASPSELAGALEGTLETMEGGLTALEHRRDQVLGPNNGVELVTKETREKIANIRELIKRLRGEFDGSTRGGGNADNTARSQAHDAATADGRRARGHHHAAGHVAP